jgi:hypothetical protein
VSKLKSASPHAGPVYYTLSITVYIFIIENVEVFLFALRFK